MTIVDIKNTPKTLITSVREVIKQGKDIRKEHEQSRFTSPKKEELKEDK